MSFHIVPALLASGPALFTNAMMQYDYIMDLDRAEKLNPTAPPETGLNLSTPFEIIAALFTTAYYVFAKVVDKLPPSIKRPRPRALTEFSILAGAMGAIGIGIKISNMKDIWERHSADLNTKKKVQRAALDGVIFVATGSLAIAGCLAADKFIKKLA